MKKHTLDNGIAVTTYDPPPAGFDPMTASQRDLDLHGFPSRPTDPHHLARYQHVFDRLKGKLNYVVPTFRVNAEKFHRPRQPSEAAAAAATAAGTETSGNWSGAVVYAPAGQHFSWMEGDWVVPDVSAPTQNQWYYCASWIGIDGDGSGDVFQAGVECEAYRSGSSISRNVYPWWEWYPNGEVQITNFPVSPGDMMTMVLCSNKGAGSTTGTVFFSNRTTGTSTSLTLTAPSGTTLSGNCAEWIVEAPTVGGSQSAMADYGEVFFSVCEAVTSTGTTVQGGTGNNMNMVAAGKIVSSGTLITPAIVQCQYTGVLPT